MKVVLKMLTLESYNRKKNLTYVILTCNQVSKWESHSKLKLLTIKWVTNFAKGTLGSLFRAVLCVLLGQYLTHIV